MSNMDMAVEENVYQKTLEKARDARFHRLLLLTQAFAVGLFATFTAGCVLSALTPSDSQAVVLTPDYPLVDEEPNAIPTNDGEEKMDAGENGGAVAVVYSDEVSYVMDKDEVTLSYTNPSSSTDAVILQVIVYGGVNEKSGKQDEYLIAQSGTLEPGYKVENLSGDLDGSIKLSEGVYSGVLRLLFYNPETGEKSLVNTEIPVNISVLETSREKEETTTTTEETEAAGDTPAAE